jgi:hypothetical protein
MRDGKVVEYRLTRPESRPFSVAVDAANNVWYIFRVSETAALDVAGGPNSGEARSRPDLWALEPINAGSIGTTPLPPKWAGPEPAKHHPHSFAR